MGPPNAHFILCILRWKTYCCAFKLQQLWVIIMIISYTQIMWNDAPGACTAVWHSRCAVIERNWKSISLEHWKQRKMNSSETRIRWTLIKLYCSKWSPRQTHNFFVFCCCWCCCRSSLLHQKWSSRAAKLHCRKLIRKINNSKMLPCDYYYNSVGKLYVHSSIDCDRRDWLNFDCAIGVRERYSILFWFRLLSCSHWNFNS